MKDQVIVKLSEREHILKRPSMYIGSVSPEKRTEYIFSDGLFRQTEITYISGLMKLFNELLDNTLDEYVRTDGKFANKIDIKMTKSYFEISDNGRGIPVKKVKTPDGELYQPELAWTHARAGSNFDDTKSSTTIGTNGVGSMIASVFSKEFIGTTSDGSKMCVVKCKDNNETIETKISNSKKKGTKVRMVPDFSRFNIKEIEDVYIQLMKQRILNLSVAYPKIEFKMNNHKLHMNAKEFIQKFGSNGVIIDKEKYSIGIFNSDTDEFKHFTLMNGLTLSSGGTHLTVITEAIVPVIREKLIKKYKDIKPADVKNKLFIVTIMRDFENPRYETQTKEKLTNSTKEVNEYFKGCDFKSVAEKVLKNKTIIDPIIELYRIKEEMKKRAELKALDKPKKKITSDKYMPATGKRKYLFLCEGASASGGISSALGREFIGYYELKGVPLNVHKSTHDKFLKNPELSELYTIIKNEGYEYIISATDADLDGHKIKGMIIGFMNKYFPDYMVNKRTGFFKTPIMSVMKNKMPVKWVYEISQAHTLKGDIKYFKGLGTHTDKGLAHIIKTDGLENMIELFEYDEQANETIDSWLNEKRADDRKKMILKNDFDIIKL